MRPTNQLFVVMVAGQPCEISATALKRYACRNGTKRTLQTYDRRAAEWKDELTFEDVVLTRKIKSRISDAEAKWFVDAGRDAPWDRVTMDDSLADADPVVLGSTYWRADALYRHFIDQRAPGVAMGKVSKVLHLMRPKVIPIFDAQVRRRYRHYAREIAASLDDFPYRHAYWAAVRQDLLDPRTEQGLAEIRTWARGEHDEDVARLAALTDVRLLDVIAWETERNPA